MEDCRYNNMQKLLKIPGCDSRSPPTPGAEGGRPQGAPVEERLLADGEGLAAKQRAGVHGGWARQSGCRARAPGGGVHKRATWSKRMCHMVSKHLV